MRSLFAFATLVLGSAIAFAAPTPALPPDWMSGHWLSCENGVRTAETWIGAGSGTLVGVNHTYAVGGPDKSVNFEFSRIALNAGGALTYFAMPSGAPVTEFPVASEADRRIVFENQQHDFPQRVIYERNGDQLLARIEGKIDGRLESQDWRFRRAEIDARCQ